MFSRQFKCILKSDVILNQKSASQGPNRTLHFIPGSVFLGIVALHYSEFAEKAFSVFHNGDIRFGDAHLALGKSRTLHVPASFFHPKYDNASHYNYHLINNPHSEETKRLQLKQDREGYFDFTSCPPSKATDEITFAMKSAYDRDKRCAEDSKMFGYESIRKGHTFYFEVEATDSGLLDIVTDYLTGVHRIGRSKTAQFGLIEIEVADFKSEPSTSSPLCAGLYSVYADGRLIFLDETGLPTFRPSAQDLGFADNAQIIWELSNIQTFQYAPFNWKRKCFDADRCGIEKGSVFIVRAKESPSISAYVGYFKNEGFGKVLYNPRFLSIPQFEEPLGIKTKKAPVTGHLTLSEGDSDTLRYLKKKHNDQLSMKLITQEVNLWAKENLNCFKGESFASQWGSIRSIAFQSKGDGYEQVKDCINEYLRHGVASERWKERRRLELLNRFIDNQHRIVPGYEWIAIINLSNVMQKMV